MPTDFISAIPFWRSISSCEEATVGEKMLNPNSRKRSSSVSHFALPVVTTSPSLPTQAIEARQSRTTVRPG